MRFPLRKVWHAEVIARALGVDLDAAPRPQVADFLVALGEGYDAVRRVQGHGMHRVVGFTAKRAKVATWVRSGGRLWDAAECGVEWHDVINILTQAKPSQLWRWTEERWDRFEKAIRAASRPSRDIAREFDMNISTVTRFFKLFHGPPLIRA